MNFVNFLELPNYWVEAVYLDTSWLAIGPLDRKESSKIQVQGDDHVNRAYYEALPKLKSS